MGLSGFKMLILMAQTPGEVTVMEEGGRGKKLFLSLISQANSLAQWGNVFIFSKPAEPMDRG